MAFVTAVTTAVWWVEMMAAQRDVLTAGHLVGWSIGRRVQRLDDWMDHQTVAGWERLWATKRTDMKVDKMERRMVMWIAVSSAAMMVFLMVDVKGLGTADLLDMWSAFELVDEAAEH